jgi:hypothetical protein
MMPQKRSDTITESGGSGKPENGLLHLQNIFAPSRLCVENYHAK